MGRMGIRIGLFGCALALYATVNDESRLLTVSGAVIVGGLLLWLFGSKR